MVVTTTPAWGIEPTTSSLGVMSPYHQAKAVVPHLDQRRKVICEHGVGLMSKVVGQVVLSPFGGGSLLVTNDRGGRGHIGPLGDKWVLILQCCVSTKIRC
jgi:hypothetical protein